MTTAAQLMTAFAERTGVVGHRDQRRYLWTDAFAVCNFLGLGQRERALHLIEAVHRTLGRGDADHPVIGGVRIGKKLPERAAGERLDERLEWDRDGQYFHYLTKWMHALHQAGLTRWARELAETAHRAFIYEARGKRRMYWKMSVDLSRPQVTSMGHHDPLDGYVTALELGLPAIAADYRAMIEPSLATADPLGIGGLLVDAHRLTQLGTDEPLRDALLAAARTGLEQFVLQPDLRLSAQHRLAFRELGLAIGLAAVEEIGAPRFERFARLRGAIETFWQDREHRRSRTYAQHEDISDVMLATSLAPEGFLRLRQDAAEPARLAST